MKTRNEIKAEKRQELISKKHPGAINFEMITKGQEINGETILSVNIGTDENTGKKGSWITIGTPKNGYRKVFAQHDMIENQPCSFIEL